MRTISRFLAVAVLVIVVPAPAVAALRVFACEPEWAALVRTLLPTATLTTATHAGQDPHHIEARPSLIAALRRADLAVCTGASLEAGWLPALQARAANPAVQPGSAGLFFAAEQVALMGAGAKADRSAGDVHPEGNPHLHLDPDRLMRVAAALARRLAELAPAEAGAIMQRLEATQAGWTADAARWKQKAQSLAGRDIVVQHGAFDYLLAFVGLRTAADLEPLPGLPPTVAHLGRVMEAVSDRKPVAILQTAYQSPQPGEWLATRTGLPLLRLPSTVTDDPATDTLPELIDTLIDRLVQAAGS